MLAKHRYLWGIYLWNLIFTILEVYLYEGNLSLDIVLGRGKLKTISAMINLLETFMLLPFVIVVIMNLLYLARRTSVLEFLMSKTITNMERELSAIQFLSMILVFSIIPQLIENIWTGLPELFLLFLIWRYRKGEKCVTRLVVIKI